MRTIPDPGFAADDGRASQRLSSALASYAGAPGPTSRAYAEVLGVLQSERLLVPVVAMLGEVEHDADGHAHEKSSDVATVLVQGADGRLALLAFTSTETLARWNPEARPVPAESSRVAAAARQDGAAAVVVDVAGPVTFVVEGRNLEALAGGFTLMQVGDQVAWVKQADS